MSLTFIITGYICLQHILNIYIDVGKGNTHYSSFNVGHHMTENVEK